MRQRMGSALVQIRLVADSAPSHFLNQCWIFVNWALRNKLQWNSIQITEVFINKNAFENILYEMVAILSRGRWVKAWMSHYIPHQTKDIITYTCHNLSWTMLVKEAPRMRVLIKFTMRYKFYFSSSSGLALSGNEPNMIQGQPSIMTPYRWLSTKLQ